MGSFWQDLRYAFRALRNSPWFAALAVVTLSLGIAVNTSIFSIVNGFILRPMPVPQPEQLAVLENRELDVEDRRFFGTGILFGASPHMAESLARLIQTVVKSLDLAAYGFVGNDAVPYVRNFPPEKVDESVHDSR